VSSIASWFRHPAAERGPVRALNESDAVDIWIARWLGIRRKDLVRRYGCDPRRLYEIWEGRRYPGAREKALEVFAERHPNLMSRVDFGRHKRIPRKPDDPDQMALFETP